MPLAHGDALIPADRADDGNIGVAFERLPQLPGLPIRSDLVENDSGDPRFAVEGRIALHQRGDPASHAAAVDDEHDRRAEELRQSGAGIGALDIDAVVQALVSFDQGDVGAARVASERRQDLGARLGVEVEIVAGAAARALEPHRVDVVWPFLEGLDNYPFAAERRRQADRQRRLA